MIAFLLAQIAKLKAAVASISAKADTIGAGVINLTASQAGDIASTTTINPSCIANKTASEYAVTVICNTDKYSTFPFFFVSKQKGYFVIYARPTKSTFSDSETISVSYIVKAV